MASLLIFASLFVSVASQAVVQMAPAPMVISDAPPVPLPGITTTAAPNQHGSEPPLQQALGSAISSLLPAATGNADSTPVNHGMFKGVSFVGDESLSERSSEVVEGLIEGYLHEAKLGWHEKRCLRSALSSMTSDVISSSEEAVVAIQALFRGGQILDTLGDEAPLLLNAGTKIMRVVQSSRELLSECMAEDVLDTLEKSSQHLTNMTYVSSRLLANGIDIAQALSDSILAFDDHRFDRFGKDIGTALRKVLLSKHSQVRHLPEGMPKSKAVEEATAGLLEGLFARGSTLTLTNLANASVGMQVDLQKCIGKNQQFWSTVWESAFTLYAKYSVNGEEYGLEHESPEKSAEENRLSYWDAMKKRKQEEVDDIMGDVGMALMQVPLALQNCHINMETASILLDSIRSLNTTRISFHLPGSHQNVPADMKMRVSDAVYNFKRWDFEDFGKDLGYMLRDTLLLAFPEKYAVDSAGHLFPTSQGSPSVQLMGQAVSFVAGVSLVILGAVAAARRLRRKNEVESLMDVEMASDTELYVE